MILIESDHGEPMLKVIASLRLKNWDKKQLNHKHSILHPNKIDVADVFARLKRMVVKTEIMFERSLYFEKDYRNQHKGDQENNRKLSLKRFLQSLLYKIEYDNVSERS